MGTRPIIAELSERIRAIERNRHRSAPETDFTPPGMSALGRLLNEPGWPRGCLVEWLAEGRGSGSTGLALWASREAWRDNLLVMIDSRRELHAPAAMPFAVDLSKTVFIRPEQPLDALWSLEQALRTRGMTGDGIQRRIRHIFRSTHFQTTSTTTRRPHRERSTSPATTRRRGTICDLPTPTRVRI